MPRFHRRLCRSIHPLNKLPQRPAKSHSNLDHSFGTAFFRSHQPTFGSNYVVGVRKLVSIMCFMLSTYHSCIERQENCRSLPCYLLCNQPLLLTCTGQISRISSGIPLAPSTLRSNQLHDLSALGLQHAACHKACCQLSSATNDSIPQPYSNFTTRWTEPLQGPIRVSLAQLECATRTLIVPVLPSILRYSCCRLFRTRLANNQRIQAGSQIRLESDRCTRRELQIAKILGSQQGATLYLQNRLSRHNKLLVCGSHLPPRKITLLKHLKMPKRVLRW